MQTAGTLQEWVKGFEKEMQMRFNPYIKINVGYAFDEAKTSSAIHFRGITQLVCAAAGVDLMDMQLIGRQGQEITDCRMLAMYYSYHLVERKVTSIGRFFNRHHSTVLHALQTVQDRIDAKDEVMLALIKKVENGLAALHGCKIKTNENKV